ncbi:hypothetical protein ACJZ2D_009606 [Fusarium nematophilum]
MASNTSPLDFSVFNNIIDGSLSSTQQTRHGINPSTLEPNPKVPVSEQPDVDRAVTAARKAFESWRLVPEAERRQALSAFASSLAEHTQVFSTWLTKEQGRPIWGTQMELAASVARLEAAAQISLPETVVEETDERAVVTTYTPMGVACGILPWNSQRFFPPGVVQCLSGDDRLGPWLAAHPGIDKISFTGSIETGKKVMEVCGRTLKRVTLELLRRPRGGNDAAIVYPDVDVDSIAAGTFTAAVQSFKLGDGFAEGVLLGPLQNEMQYNKVKALISNIKSENLKVTTEDSSSETPKAGYFIQPVVVDNPPDEARVVAEEPFGPLLPLLSWSDEEEVIRRANDSRYALGASVWTKSLDNGKLVAKRLEAGSVWVNNHMDMSPMAPFGGHKSSGIGVEGGLAGVLGYCNMQTLYLPKK